jgi:hypothetical protein
MRKLMLAAGALALMTGLAQAADDERNISNPTTVVQNVTADDVAGMLRELGAANVSIGESEKEKIVSFSDGGVPFHIAITVCEKANPTKCIGLAQLTLIEDKNYSYATLNKFNAETLTLTLFKNDKQTHVGLARIDLIDGGVTRERIANGILWYVAEVHETLDSLAKQVLADANANGKSDTLATAIRPIAATPEVVARIVKAMGQTADDKPLKRLNAKTRTN